MLPDIPKTTRPDTMAVVALADPVVLRIMVTRGLDEFRRRSTEGIQIWCRIYQYKLFTADPVVMIGATHTANVIIMIRPRIPFVKMAQNIAVGTARLALRVSSPIWMTLSKA